MANMRLGPDRNLQQTCRRTVAGAGCHPRRALQQRQPRGKIEPGILKKK